MLSFSIRRYSAWRLTARARRRPGRSRRRRARAPLRSSRDRARRRSIARAAAAPARPRSAAVIAAPVASSAARCSAFFSSRTLPGQRCARSASRASARQLLARRARKCVRERQDVVGALGERRHAQLDHVEPVVEVLAERAGADHRAAGRRWSR